MSNLANDAIPEFIGADEMTKKSSEISILHSIPNIDTQEKGDFEKRKKNGIKKLSLVKRLFRWKLESDPLTTTTDGPSTPSTPSSTLPRANRPFPPA